MDFEDAKMAEEAVKGEVHRDFNGQTLRVEIATGKSSARRDGRLSCGGNSYPLSLQLAGITLGDGIKYRT